VNTKNINVYIIDDNEDTIYYLVDTLKDISRIGEITTYTSSEQALEDIIDKNKKGEQLPDLILLDVRIPDLDGFEFIDEIDQHFNEFTPVVAILTSSKHRKDVESFDKQFIAKEFLNKPLEKESIDALIAKYFA
jgi:CheY-like chemotaxis protein